MSTQGPWVRDALRREGISQDPLLVGLLGEYAVRFGAKSPKGPYRAVLRDTEGEEVVGEWAATMGLALESAVRKMYVLYIAPDPPDTLAMDLRRSLVALESRDK